MGNIQRHYITPALSVEGPRLLKAACLACSAGQTEGRHIDIVLWQINDVEHARTYPVCSQVLDGNTVNLTGQGGAVHSGINKREQCRDVIRGLQRWVYIAPGQVAVIAKSKISL